MVVTSLQEQDGATSVSTNCAISFAQLQAGDVLLIDANMRRPTVDRIFGVSNACGLSSFLAGRAGLSDVIVPAWYQTQRPPDVDVEIPGLYVIPAGPVPMNPVELLASPRFPEGLTALSQRFAHIVIDAPPMAGVSDAMVLAPRTEGVILVLRHGRAARDTARHAIRMLESVRARILGVVLNHADLTTPRRGPYASATSNGVHGGNGFHDSNGLA
jgi:capsular exopolysaccharide synthesis family protein